MTELEKLIHDMEERVQLLKIKLAEEKLITEETRKELDRVKAKIDAIRGLLNSPAAAMKSILANGSTLFISWRRRQALKPCNRIYAISQVNTIHS